MSRKLELFLDENHHRNKLLRAALSQNEITYHVYGDYFPPQVPDTEWMPLVAEHSWAILTTDKRIRYRPSERAAVYEHRIAMFCFTSNMGGERMAKAIFVATKQMRRIIADETPPFIATISESGAVIVRERFDSERESA